MLPSGETFTIRNVPRQTFSVITIHFYKIVFCSGYIKELHAQRLGDRKDRVILKTSVVILSVIFIVLSFYGNTFLWR